MTELLTPRLRLRLMHGDDDACLYRALYTSPEVMAHIATPMTPEAADAAFARVCAHNARDTPGHRYWTIQARDTGELLGLTALTRDGSRAELGAMLLPAAWRRRVASEAFAVVLPHGFDVMGLDLIDAQRRASEAVPGERLLAPFGFERGPSTRPDWVRWLLPRERLAARPVPAHRLGIAGVAE